MTTKERLDLFKRDLIVGKLTHEEILQKYLIDGPTYFFQEHLRDASLEYSIKSVIAEAFSVHLREVIVVGSGKLGFSLKPKNVFNEFDHLYSITKRNNDKSDLDIVVISNNLYNEIGRKMYHFTLAYKNKWRTNEYYSKERADEEEIPICYQYSSILPKVGLDRILNLRVLNFAPMDHSRN